MWLPEAGGDSGDVYAAPGSMGGSGVSLKRLYASTCSMRENQDELEALVSSQSLGCCWY